MRFRETLRFELDRRRTGQPTYSVRRFARVLGVHHSTALRLLERDSPIAERTIRALGDRLGRPRADLDRQCALEKEESILRAIRRAGFRPDSRWLANVAGIPIDQVNITLHSLLRTRRLTMKTSQIWKGEAHS